MSPEPRKRGIAIPWSDVLITIASILLAFIVVILGGMGSMGGSVVAAFIIGIAQSVLSLWINPQRVAIAIFGIMIVVLIARPRGLFGREGVLE